MKEVKAIIQPFMLTKVIEALEKINGLPGMTVDKDVRGFGRTDQVLEQHRIVDDMVEYVAKIKLEIVVHDEMVEQVVRTIQAAARTGNPGDGKIFIIDVEDVIKIRTNERGEKAI
jgi:nitrogen regulatory protein P-II 1